MTIFKTNWVVGDSGHAAVHNNIGNALNGLGYSVKWFGATGDGVTDDTTAIAAAIAAIPASGGALVFPPGSYLTSGGFTIANPTTIIGCGKAGFDGATGGISNILCNSATAVLFTVTAYYAKFENVALRCTHATPTNGAGIQASGSTLVQRVDYESISVSGFYIDIDVQVGCSWVLHNSWIQAPVLYGVKINNTQNADAGDWTISDSNFFAAVRDSTAAIRIEGSGGGKITNCKINKSLDNKVFTSGIDLANTGSTSILLVNSNSFENVSGNAIKVNTTVNWDYMIISGNQFGMYGSTSTAISIACDVIGKIDGLVVANNVFYSATAVAAITLSKVNNAIIGPNIIVGFSSELSQTDCTNIRTVTTA